MTIKSVDEIKASIRQRHQLADTADVRLLTSCMIIKAVEENDPYKFTARITTDSLDRQDEVVLPSGGDLTEFLKSGAIFWNHDYNEPVGFPNKSKKILREDNYIECGAIFMQRPKDYQGDFTADKARAFVTQAKENGINPGVSIGFIPIESRSPTSRDKQQFGDNVRVVHSKWKMLEFSIAPVQANQDAVVTAVGKTIEPAPEAKQLSPVIEETICVIIRRKPKSVDVANLVRRGIERELLKSFGQVYA